jgi:hypothetical protein
MNRMYDKDDDCIFPFRSGRRIDPRRHVDVETRLLWQLEVLEDGVERALVVLGEEDVVRVEADDLLAHLPVEGDRRAGTTHFAAGDLEGFEPLDPGDGRGEEVLLSVHEAFDWKAIIEEQTKRKGKRKSAWKRGEARDR